MNNQSFSAFFINNHRVIVQDFGDKEVILEVINPELTKKYKTEQIKLNSINLNALKTGLSKSNHSIKIEFTEAQNSIELKVIIEMPLLPLIVEIINCPLLKQLNEHNQNSMILTQIANAFTKTKQIIRNIKQNQNNKQHFISFVQRQKQPYDNEGNYLDDDQYTHSHDGTLSFGSLNFINKGTYLVSLSFLGKAVGQVYFFYGDQYAPIYLFCDGLTNTISCQRQQDLEHFYCYSFREVVSINDVSQPLKIMMYDNGYGTQFVNIILTATQMK